MGTQTSLTADGQVTIPRDVLDALDLKPGEPVEFVWNDAGEAVIRKAGLANEVLEERRRAARLAIEETVHLYPMLPMDETADQYMAGVREPVPLPPR